MLGSLSRWSCLLLPLLVAVDCKPPRPYRGKAKVVKTAAHAVASAPLPALAPSASLPTLQPPLLEPNVSKLPSKYRSALERREACEFKKGAMPEQTLDPEEPIGQRIPIDHFVIVMQENRSFDHYFHDLAKFGQPDADVTPKGFVIRIHTPSKTSRRTTRPR